jgi:dolichol kinase
MRTIQRGEIARKLIHYTSTVIPVTYFFLLNRTTILGLLSICTLLMFIAEFLRMYQPTCRQLYQRIFGWLTRPHEMANQFTGATYVFMGSFLAVLLFPKSLAVMVLLFVTIGDPTACIIGRLFGRLKLINRKTLEGTLAFFLSGLLVTFWIPAIPLVLKLLGLLIAAAVELMPWKIDDNIAIPLISGMALLYLI